jgi:hypothetical protein
VTAFVPGGAPCYLGWALTGPAVWLAPAAFTAAALQE